MGTIPALQEEQRRSQKAIEKEREKTEKEKAKAYLAKIESARRFLDMGLSMEQVAQGTGLSLSEVRTLQ